MEAHKQRYEDAAEKKVQIITSAIKKSMKRKRVEDDGDSNNVPEANQVSSYCDARGINSVASCEIIC